VFLEGVTAALTADGEYKEGYREPPVKSGHIRDAIRRGPGGKEYTLPSLRCAIGEHPCPKPKLMPLSSCSVVRGRKATAETLFLDSLYRDAAGKAGITYVDVWDGFVDEAGRFLEKGPDVEGQTRQLRSSDGVYFTRPARASSRIMSSAR
jgi:hypothetical protein